MLSVTLTTDEIDAVIEFIHSKITMGKRVPEGFLKDLLDRLADGRQQWESTTFSLTDNELITLHEYAKKMEEVRFTHGNDIYRKVQKFNEHAKKRAETQ